MIDGILGFVMVLAIIMVSTKVCGLLLRKLNLPQVLGYIIAGILVGPALIGMSGFSLIGFQSEANETACFVMLDEFTLNDGGTFTILDVFSKIGVIMIMFCAGLETDLKELKKNRVCIHACGSGRSFSSACTRTCRFASVYGYRTRRRI